VFIKVLKTNGCNKLSPKIFAEQGAELDAAIQGRTCKNQKGGDLCED
jgi:hypothetical protein